MENNKLVIIALLVIIVVLLAGILVLMPNMSKQDTKLTFKGNSTLVQGDALKVKLTDANGTAIANQTVNVTVTNEDGSSDYHSVVTNAKGTGTLKLDKNPGEYSVTISYGGNDNYKGCNATKKITIEEKVTQTEETSNTNYEQNYQKLEFNGKTHEQNVQDAKDSRDKGGQWAGASDEQIEESISKIERDGGMV